MIPVEYYRTDLPKDNALRVIEAMKQSGQFWKSTRGSILWEESPGNFNPLSRPDEVADVLENAGIFEWEGDPIFSREWVLLARAVESIRWRLPVCDESRYLPSAKRDIKQAVRR